MPDLTVQQLGMEEEVDKELDAEEDAMDASGEYDESEPAAATSEPEPAVPMYVDQQITSLGSKGQVTDQLDPQKGGPAKSGAPAGAAAVSGEDPSDLIAGMLDNAVMIAFGGVGLLLGGFATRLGTKLIKKLTKKSRSKPAAKKNTPRWTNKKMRRKNEKRNCRKGCGCRDCDCQGSENKPKRVECTRKNCKGSRAGSKTCPVKMTNANCFVAGTAVDGRAVESVRLGDEVRTWLPGEPGWAGADPVAVVATEVEVWLSQEAEGGRREVGLLRPAGWLAEWGIEGADGVFELDIPELGAGRFDLLTCSDADGII